MKALLKLLKYKKLIQNHFLKIQNSKCKIKNILKTQAFIKIIKIHNHHITNLMQIKAL